MWGPYGLQIIDTLKVIDDNDDEKICDDDGHDNDGHDNDGHDNDGHDDLKVPHLPPGDYVLGWRWDCEESTQVKTMMTMMKLRFIMVIMMMMIREAPLKKYSSSFGHCPNSH